MGLRNVLFGDIERQFHLSLIGRLAVQGQSDAIRNAEHMGIDRHTRFVPKHRDHDIGRLASHTWEREQGIVVGWHLASILADDALGGGQQMMCLVIGIGDRFDVLVDLSLGGLRHPLWRGESMKQIGRYHVDTFVGTLSRKNHSHEQFEGGVIDKFGLRIGIMIEEIAMPS